MDSDTQEPLTLELLSSVRFRFWENVGVRRAPMPSLMAITEVGPRGPNFAPRSARRWTGWPLSPFSLRSDSGGASATVRLGNSRGRLRAGAGLPLDAGLTGHGVFSANGDEVCGTGSTTSATRRGSRAWRLRGRHALDRGSARRRAARTARRSPFDISHYPPAHQVRQGARWPRPPTAAERGILEAPRPGATVGWFVAEPVSVRLCPGGERPRQAPEHVLHVFDQDVEVRRRCAWRRTRRTLPHRRRLRLPFLRGPRRLAALEAKRRPRAARGSQGRAARRSGRTAASRQQPCSRGASRPSPRRCPPGGVRRREPSPSSNLRPLRSRASFRLGTDLENEDHVCRRSRHPDSDRGYLGDGEVLLQLGYLGAVPGSRSPGSGESCIRLLRSRDDGAGRPATRSPLGGGSERAANALSFLVEGQVDRAEAQEHGVQVSAAAQQRRSRTRRHDRADPPGRHEAKLSLLTAGIRAQIEQPAAQSVTPEQIRAYVDANPQLLPERAKSTDRASEHQAQGRAGPEGDQARIDVALSGQEIRERHGQPADRRARRLRPADKRKRSSNPPRTSRSAIGRTCFRVTAILPPRPMPRDQQEAIAWETLSNQAQQQAIDVFTGRIPAEMATTDELLSRLPGEPCLWPTPSGSAKPLTQGIAPKTRIYAELRPAPLFR